MHSKKVWRIINSRATAKRKREAAQPTLWDEHYIDNAKKYMRMLNERIEKRKNKKEKLTEPPVIERMPKFFKKNETFVKKET